MFEEFGSFSGQLCVACLVMLCFLFNIMASFDILDDDDYGDMFITQTPRQERISLEDNRDDNCVDSVIYDHKYSDISDNEEDTIEKWIR